MVQTIAEVARRIELKVMALRLERANQLATRLLLRQRTERMDDVVSAAEAAGVATAA